MRSTPARGLLLSVLIVLCAVGTPADGAEGFLHRRESDDSKVVFEIDLSGYTLDPSPSLEGTERLNIAGFGTFSGPGAPMIPARDFLVALPPGGGFSVRFTVLRSRALGRHRLEPVAYPIILQDDSGFAMASQEYRIDDAVYGAGATTVSVIPQGEGRLRQQRVLPIRVIPVSYDPGTGETVLATSIRIEVSFAGDAGGRLGGAGRRVQESAEWERVFSRLLVNPVPARAWRFGTEVPRVEPRRAARVAEVTSGVLVKLSFRGGGLLRVRASTVVALGFPPSTAVSNIHLFKRVYNSATFSEDIIDIPYKIIEDPAGISGVFDGSDQIVFYGQLLRKDTDRVDPIEKFADDNLYWLGDTAGTPMAPKSVGVGTVSADTATAFFPVTRYFEQDLIFFEETPPGRKDFAYYHSPFKKSFSAPFDLDAVRAAGQFQIKAAFQGGDVLRSLREVIVEVKNTKGKILLNSVFVPRKNAVTYTSNAASAGALVEGLNTLTIGVPSGGRSILEVLLNWFEVSYESPYRAKGNVLDFNTASLSGSSNLTVTGLSRTDVMLFDVTDPLAPLDCQLSAGHFINVGTGFDLAFTEILNGQRRYIAAPLEKIPEIAAGDMELDVPSTLIGNPAENGVDILVVSNALFLSEIQRWVDHRRSQGYRVLLANVEEIYDEFNGGVKNPRAIKRFIKHFFQKGNASFVLLVGDSSEDSKRIHTGIDGSGIDYVPTESFTEHVFGGGFNEDEVVTSDKWYVMLDFDFVNEPWSNITQWYPDLIIGRLPVGTVGELRNVLDKIFPYEKPRADEFWRRRMIRIADDAWSFGTGDTCFQPGEVGFQTAEENAAQITENSMPGGFDVVRFFLSDRIDHPTPPTCVNQFVQRNRTRSEATPAMLAEIAKGATIVSMQTHMNRFQVCHEFLFTTSNVFGIRDHLQLANVGKPYVFFGMGCHFSDYALHKELGRTTSNGSTGDCGSELMLFLKNKGAISTYGSTGFEYLGVNLNYTTIAMEAFFKDPPAGAMPKSGRVQRRWILGEVLTVAEIENIIRFGIFGSGDGAVGQTKRYHILGDPLLRMDAGPPRFHVTVDGDTVQTGDPLIASSKDSVEVVAVISDEVAIENLTLEIAGVDETNTMTITPLDDVALDAARRYEVKFKHLVRPEVYDIVLRAHQAADTTASSFFMVAEFVLKVDIGVTLSVDGRPIIDGDLVPPGADYAFALNFPLTVDPAMISVKIDGDDFSPVNKSQIGAQDSTSWAVSFTTTLSAGQHQVSVLVDNIAFPFQVVVGSTAGLRNVIVFPNPFVDDAHFLYTNDIGITNGRIDVFTTSGRRVAHIDIPSRARAVGQNAVKWDGRTSHGDEIANGVYLFVIKINQGGRESTHRGRIVHMR